MTEEQIKRKAKTYSKNYWYNTNNSVNVASIEKLLIDFATETTKELEKELQIVKQNKHTVAYLGECIEQIQDKKIAELELKIKHLTQHLEPQEMTALFEQVEEEVRLEQRVKELEWHDLEENPNDLPNNCRHVWCDYGDGYGKGFFDKDDGGWWIEGHMYCSAIDAWCELPKRNKGDK